jgi:hypothetical protein
MYGVSQRTLVRNTINIANGYANSNIRTSGPQLFILYLTYVSATAFLIGRLLLFFDLGGDRRQETGDRRQETGGDRDRGGAGEEEHRIQNTGHRFRKQETWGWELADRGFEWEYWGSLRCREVG